MGGGSWTSTAYCSYTATTRGMTAETYADSRTYINVQDAFKARGLDPALNPHGVTRECLDSEEHPNTVPVILALDVTGSMGKAATMVSKKLGQIMEKIYEYGKVKDIEFCVMAIGDLAYDRAPVQISQFESDIRIAEQLDKVWFEGGGGGNAFESYTAAWYMGLYHCKLDCWKRGERGIIITLGDEQLNPYLSKARILQFIGDSIQEDVETPSLYQQAVQKYNIHHISVNDQECCYERNNYGGVLDRSWQELLNENYHVSTIEGLEDMITNIVVGEFAGTAESTTIQEISW